MTPYLSAVQAMMQLCTQYYGSHRNRVLYITHGIFRYSAALAQEWPAICKRLPQKDLPDIELPLGLHNSVTLKGDGTVIRNFKKEWSDIPPCIAAALKASTQLDQGCLDILSAAGISVPEPIVDTKPEPGIVQKAFNLADAMVSWARSGFKIASEEQYKARKAICLSCDQWNGEGYLGAGACKACGCTGAKLYIASSECPLKKWS